MKWDPWYDSQGDAAADNTLVEIVVQYRGAEQSLGALKYTARRWRVVERLYDAEFIVVVNRRKVDWERFNNVWWNFWFFMLNLWTPNMIDVL